MIPTPLELSLGEPFEDVSFNPAGTSASSAKKAWDDAASSLARDPAVALAPLRFLAANRFGVPDPWPVEAPRFLLDALAVANATATSSPSLASDIWSLGAILLGTWARWRSERHPGGTSEAREILGAIARTIREHAARAHDGAGRKLANAPFAASQLGATPVLTLACVASAPLCPRETRAGALRDVARIAGLAVNNGGIGGTGGIGGGVGGVGPYPGTLTRPESSAQRLVAAFVYATSAADDPVYITQLCASVFPAWRGYRNGPSANDSPEDAVASQTSGLLLTRAVQATAATFPDAAASLASTARAVLRGAPIDRGEGETSLNLGPRPDECRSAAAYVAAGLQLATRRGALRRRDADRRTRGIASVTSARTPSARASRSRRVPRGEVFRARRRRRRDVGERGSHESDRGRRRRDANQGGRRSSGELGARSMVHRDVVRARARPVPSVRRDTPRRRVGRAGSHLGRYQRIVRGGRVCVTRVGEVEVGSGKSVRARRGVRARAPRQTRPRDRDAGGRASRGATRVGRRFRRRFGKTGVGSIHSFANRARELAVAVHDAFRGFKSIAPTTWQRSLDASATHPAFQGPFLAALALLRGVPLLSPGASADDVSPALAAIDALARLEFARTPDPRYATLLRDVANALASDDARSARLARATCETLFPDPVAELDAICGGGVAWSDDDALGSRAHLLLRLVPYAAPRLAGPGGADPGVADPGGAEEGASVLADRVMPCVERCLAHGRDALVRAAHVAAVAIFRSHGRSRATQRWFPSYLNRSLEMFPHRTPAEPFVAAIGTVAMYGELGSRLPCLAAAGAADRAAALDRVGDASSMDAASSLRRLVFGLLALVDHAVVPEMRAIAESAMMSAGRGGRDAGEVKAARARAYDDLVAGGVLACSDYGRRNSLVQWALRCKSML